MPRDYMADPAFFTFNENLGQGFAGGRFAGIDAEYFFDLPVKLTHMLTGLAPV